MFYLLKIAQPARHISTLRWPLFFRATTPLLAEPLKKKKKIDPQILKQREERRKKRLEKMIRKLEKSAKQLKPIDECEVPEELIRNREIHTRPVPSIIDEIEHQRISLFKEWAVYKTKQQLADIKMCDRLLNSQQRALDELRKESEELYQAAIQLDNTLIPFKIKGPVETPPIENYPSPDGEYTDISKKWETN